MIQRFKIFFFHKLESVYKSTLAPFVRRRVIASSGFSPQIVVMVDGGLGSQMFQYALGRLLQINSTLPVLFDLSWYTRFGTDLSGKNSRKYQLEEVFSGVKVIVADMSIARFYRLNFDTCPSEIVTESAFFTSQSPRYLGGYYTVTKYIEENKKLFKEEFKFNMNLSSRNHSIYKSIINSECAIAVHVRRGDFVGTTHDVVTEVFFRTAMSEISDRLRGCRPRFFIFSNDMDWCRRFFSGYDSRIDYIDNNNNDNGALDMYLMSNCHHFVISNSSFSWWAAFLSDRSRKKLVYMPKIWNARDRVKDRMCVNGWIRVDN